MASSAIFAGKTSFSQKMRLSVNDNISREIQCGNLAFFAFPSFNYLVLSPA
jgi:hypothetical protein